MGEDMRIPKDSTFSKELSKKFKQIFHRDMTLGGLQDLQDNNNLVNPVDTHLINQVSKLGKKDEPKENVSSSRAVRQEYTQGKGLVGKIVEAETKEKGFGI
jgi:hypothetical protein